MKMQKILENQQINIQRKVLLKALLCLKPEPRIRLRILEDSEGVKQRRYYDKNGNADMDIDYRHGGTGHTFPHRHDWNNGVRGPAY
ncbi:hypothetical protein [Faecalibacterium sp. 9]|uniref:hypothetical protein n=1 Tax=Faecalibacterium sp. 9 TaxID=3402018 RepID=UPI003AABDEBF